MINLENLVLEVNDIVLKTGHYLKSEIANINAGNIESKGNNDFVTYVDKTAEKQLVEGLAKLLPEAGFITEEKTIEKEGEVYSWVIDPLDGTTNYIHGFPFYAVSVGLMRGDKVVLGVIYDVCQNEIYYATENSKAYINGVEIQVSKADKIKDSLLNASFPNEYNEHVDSYFTLYQLLDSVTHGMRRLGSTALSLCYVAAGRLDGYYSMSYSSWDVAAGVLIVKQAGGKVTSFDKDDNVIFGETIIASNKNIYNDLQQIIDTKFYSKISIEEYQ